MFSVTRRSASPGQFDPAKVSKAMVRPSAESHGESFREDDEERDFDRTSTRWAIGIFLATITIGGALVIWWISTLPYTVTQ